MGASHEVTKCVRYSVAKVEDAATVPEGVPRVPPLWLIVAIAGFWPSQKGASPRQLWTKSPLKESSQRRRELTLHRVPTDPSEDLQAKEGKKRAWVYFAEQGSDWE